MRSSTKIAISLPTDLLAQVDDLASRLGLSRSALIRRAVQELLERYLASQMAVRAREVYTLIDKAEQKMAEDFRMVSSETIPSYPTEDSP